MTKLELQNKIATIEKGLSKVSSPTSRKIFEETLQKAREELAALEGAAPSPAPSGGGSELEKLYEQREKMRKGLQSSNAVVQKGSKMALPKIEARIAELEGASPAPAPARRMPKPTAEIPEVPATKPMPTPAKRGRKPSPPAPMPIPTPAKRGRKPKAEAPMPMPTPAKRGRKPKAEAPVEIKGKIKRGRKPKVQAPAEIPAKAPARRGRPSLPKGAKSQEVSLNSLTKFANSIVAFCVENGIADPNLDDVRAILNILDKGKALKFEKGGKISRSGKYISKWQIKQILTDGGMKIGSDELLSGVWLKKKVDGIAEMRRGGGIGYFVIDDNILESGKSVMLGTRRISAKNRKFQGVFEGKMVGGLMKVYDYDDEMWKVVNPDEWQQAYAEGGGVGGKQYFLTGYRADASVDSYDEGQGDYVSYFDEKISKTFSSKDDLIKYISKNITYTDHTESDFNWEDGEGEYITTSVLCSYDAQIGYFPASKLEIDLWKKGEKELYNVDYYIDVVAAIPTKYADGGGVASIFRKAKNFGNKTLKKGVELGKSAKQKTEDAIRKKKKEIALDILYEVKENLAEGRDEKNALEKSFAVVSDRYEKGGGVGEFPTKGELTNKDNFLLKYEKKGGDYEFFVYKPEKKDVSSYEQIKYVCVNKDCPTRMSYNQFLNYLYAETYLDDRKYANGGGVGKDILDKKFWKDIAHLWRTRHIDIDKNGDWYNTEEYKGVNNTSGLYFTNESANLIVGLANSYNVTLLDVKNNNPNFTAFDYYKKRLEEFRNKEYADGGGVGGKDFVVKIYSTNFENTLISERTFKTEKAAIRYAYSVEDLNDDGFYFNIFGLDKNGKNLIKVFGLIEAEEDLIRQNPKYKNCISWKLDMGVHSYPNNKTIFSKTFSRLDKALELAISLENESLSATINNLDYTTFIYANGGGVEIPKNKSLRHFILNEMSDGSIANRTPFSDYATIDKIRIQAVQILNRDGDREYSMQSVSDLIQEALLEYEENKNYAEGGGVGNFAVGQSVTIAENNDNENYDDFRGKELVIYHKATNEKEHRGFDNSMEGQALYSFFLRETGEQVPFSCYDYELEQY